jgi:hypothetical protein
MEAVCVNDARMLYLYGFVAAPVPLDGLFGVEDNTRVELVDAGEFACIVSHVPASEYGSRRESWNAAAQMDWVTPRAWRHHEVIRQVHQETTVIPLKFGTLCSSIDDLRDLLGRRADAVASLLAQFRGKDEWSLAVSVDAATVGSDLHARDPELLVLTAEERTLPAGRAYFVRKRITARTAELLAQHMAAVADTVFARLTSQGLAIVPDPCGTTAAILVDRTRFADFAQTLSTLEHEHRASDLLLEVRGPWAPYSFVTALD